MLKQLCWTTPSQPLLILNGSVVEIDIVADTILQHSLLKSKLQKVSVRIEIYDKKQTIILQSEKIVLQNYEQELTCWDFIHGVNDLIIAIGGKYFVKEISEDREDQNSPKNHSNPSKPPTITLVLIPVK